MLLAFAGRFHMENRSMTIVVKDGRASHDGRNQDSYALSINS
jgi:hypothetical protein